MIAYDDVHAPCSSIRYRGTRNSAAFIIAILELVPPKPADTGSATCHARRRHRPLLMRLSSIGDGTSLKDPNVISEKIAKAKRTRLTIAQKIEVGHLLQVGNANTTVMRQFKISERTIETSNALFLHSNKL